jgi:hypothetical protein
MHSCTLYCCQRIQYPQTHCASVLSDESAVTVTLLGFKHTKNNATKQAALQTTFLYRKEGEAYAIIGGYLILLRYIFDSSLFSDVVK